MIAHERPRDELRENAAGVSEELIGGVNTARWGRFETILLSSCQQSRPAPICIAIAATVDESVGPLAIQVPLQEVRVSSSPGMHTDLPDGAVLANTVGLAVVAANRLVVLASLLQTVEHRSLH